MTKKQVLIAAFIAVFFISALVGVQFLNLVAAQPRDPPPLPSIYIRSDGRVEPSTAPILRVKEVYVFTGNITDYTVEVQRNNIVIDGAGFFIEQTEEAKKIPEWAMIPAGCRPGIKLEDRRNVTVKNLNSRNCMTGIYLRNSSNIIITKNKFTGNNAAIVFASSDNNTIVENNVVGNYGYWDDHLVSCSAIIFVGSCSYNTITKNNISKNNGGVSINFDTTTGSPSCCNKITMNNITSNKEYGLRLYSNSNVTVVGNTIANNKYGIMVGYTGHSTFYYNNFINNTVQVSSRTPTNEPNAWDNGREGNYWSDYNGTDDNGDGIGDTPYIIERQKVWIEPTTNTPITFGVDTEDRYPLMKPIGIQVFPDEKNPITTSEPFPTTPPTEPPPDGSTGPDPTPFLIAVPIVLAIILGVAVYRRKRSTSNKHQKSLFIVNI